MILQKKSCLTISECNFSPGVIWYWVHWDYILSISSSFQEFRFCDENWYEQCKRDYWHFFQNRIWHDIAHMCVRQFHSEAKRNIEGKKLLLLFHLWLNRSVHTRTATGMDGTLPHCSFENLKPVEISKNCFHIIWTSLKVV